MIALVLCAYAFMAVLDLPALIHKKCRSELMAYGAVFVLSLLLAVMKTFGAEIPTVVNGLKFVIEDMLGLSYGLAA